MRYAVFGVICLGVLYAVQTLHNWLVLLFCYLLAVLALLAVRVTNRPAQVLKSSRRLSHGYAHVGQPVTVSVTAAWQAGAGPGWVMVRDTLNPAVESVNAPALLTTIGMDSSCEFTYRIMGRQRGFHAIGPLEVTVGDLFGLAQSTAKSDDISYLTVYPRIQPIPPLRLPSNRPIGDAPSSNRMYEDTTRIVGVREYAPGDTQTKIHWKTTARLGALMTKMSEPSTAVEVHLLLNLAAGDYPANGPELELACTLAASVADALLAGKHLVGLQTNGYDPNWQFQQATSPLGIAIRPNRGELQNGTIMSALGRVQLSERPALADYLALVHSQLPWSSSILLLTHRLTEEAAVMLDNINRAGFELAAIVVGEGETAEAARARIASLNIPVAAAPTEKDLGLLEFWQPGRS